MIRRAFLSRPVGHFLCAMLACTLAAASASAQQTRDSFTPQLGQSGKDVMWLPSHDQVANMMLRLAAVTPRDYVVDLGSGDGKIPIAAARDYGVRALGLEYNADLVELSKRRAREAGLEAKVKFEKADIFESDYSSATVVTLYLLPELNLRLRPTLMKMKPGTRIVSNSFEMGSWSPDETAFIGTTKAMLWVIPAHVAGTWTVSYQRKQPAAPATINLRQNFQKLEGEGVLSQARMSLQYARLRASDVSFEVRDDKGALLSYKAKVEGNRMVGTVSSSRGARIAFQAQRGDAPVPFAEAKATPEEEAEAVRALGR